MLLILDKQYFEYHQVDNIIKLVNYKHRQNIEMILTTLEKGFVTNYILTDYLFAKDKKLKDVIP